jgi:hypothetical protein
MGCLLAVVERQPFILKQEEIIMNLINTDEITIDDAFLSHIDDKRRGYVRSFIKESYLQKDNFVNEKGTRELLDFAGKINHLGLIHGPEMFFF